MADNVIVRVPEQQFIRGEDGYSPEVTIEDITHGHSVTITDRDHPEGQSFNVMDGASAYEQAVAGGYTGTEAQFNEELASFKELSEQAADSANTAAGAAFRAQNYERHAGDAEDAARAYADIALIRMNSADASAQAAASSETAAAGSAGDASTAATTATTKAGEASDSATAADGSAKDSEAYAIGKRGGTDVDSTDPAYHNNAKYYAEQASGSASDAATAKGAAETAQGLAESAQTAAETAQGKAEDAQEAAEAVLASIPSDYTTLSGDVDNLKSANDYVIKTKFPYTFEAVPFLSSGGFVNGRINTTTGSNASSTTRARRSNSVLSGNYVSLGTDDYEYTLFYYDGLGSSWTDTYTHVYSDWIKGSVWTLIDDSIGDRARMVIRHPDDSTISDADLDILTRVCVARNLNQITLQITTKKGNPVYIGELEALARDWYSHRNDIVGGSKAMVYGNNSILNTSSYTREIDCSTFVGMLLRGYSFSQTPYATGQGASPDSWTGNTAYNWTFNPFDYSNYSRIDSSSRSKVRYASQMAEMMIERGQSVPIDRYYANIEPGDVLFFARHDSTTNDWFEPLRFKHINHVAICIGKEKATSADGWDTATYPWKHLFAEVGHEDETTPDGVIKIRTLEQPQGDTSAIFENNINTLCLVCRPDLGSISDDYTELSGDVDDLKSAINDPVTGLDTKAPIIIDSASGAIASFPDGADNMPIKALTVNVEPIQDLHGYDSPWPDGGGANKFGGEIVVGKRWQDGSYVTAATDNYAASEAIINCSPSTEYCVTLPDITETTAFYCVEFDANGNYIRMQSALSLTPNNNAKVFSTSADAYKIAASFYCESSIQPASIAKFAINYPSTITTWTPYSNICPISGRTSATVTRTGKNLFDINTIRSTANGMTVTIDGQTVKVDGTSSASGRATLAEFQFLKAGTYHLHTSGDLLWIKAWSLLGADATVTVDDISVVYRLATATLTSGTEYHLTATENQIEIGSSFSAYEPYQGNTYTIQLSDTVYGGQLDVTAGKMVVDRAMVDLGTLTWVKESDSGLFRTTLNEMVHKSLPLCSAYKGVIVNSTNLLNDLEIASTNSQTLNLLRVKDIREWQTLDASGFKQAVSGIQLVYELATPIEITLTPTQIDTLLGMNNIWSDAGTVDVDYCADTKLYVDKKIAAAIAAALNA